MKLHLKTLVMGAMLAASIGCASATATPTTVIHISGSTAYRSAVNAAVLAYLASNFSGGTNTAPTYTYVADTTTSLSKQTAAAYLSQDGTVGVETYWSGSVAGCIDLVAGNSLANKFIDVTTAVLGNSQNNAAPTVASAVVDFAWTDATIASAGAVVNGANIAGGGATTGGAVSGAQLNALLSAPGAVNEAGTLGQTTQGIAPFVWAVGKSAVAAPFTNMTTEAARALITSGVIPLPFLSGSTAAFNGSASTSQFVYFVNRAEDSGTRENALQNSNFPVGAACKSYQIAFNPNVNVLVDPNFPAGLNTGGVGATVSGASLWAGNLKMNTNTNISWTATGHYGYIGGPDVASVLSATNPTNINIPAGPKGLAAAANTGEYFVGALSAGDGGTVATNGGVVLSFNGVSETTPNVQNGTYTFWGYEHAYVLPTLNADILNLANGIADQVYGVNAGSSGVQITTSLLAKKTSDGGAISKNY